MQRLFDEIAWDERGRWCGQTADGEKPAFSRPAIDVAPNSRRAYHDYTRGVFICVWCDRCVSFDFGGVSGECELEDLMCDDCWSKHYKLQHEYKEQAARDSAGIKLLVRVFRWLQGRDYGEVSS